jgi:GPI-anchor transamidase subunit GAA1
MVISASWLSFTGDDNLNLRGVSTVLALAAFLKRLYSSLEFSRVL